MFTIERLEDRMLMAANVSQSGGTLTITGDNSDDAILVEGTGNGEVEVFADTDGDGAVDDSLGTFTGVQNIKVNSRGGDDAIGFDGVEIVGFVDIKAGSGDDCALLVDSDIGGNVTMNMGAGNDLAVAQGEFGGDMVVKLGGGNDAVIVEDADIDGKLDVNAGGGNDLIGVNETNVNVGDKITLNGAGGQDYLIGEDVGDLQQQLAQLGAKVKGFEVFSDGDNLPASVTDPIEAHALECVARLTL